MPEEIRAFIAIELPAGVRAAIVKVQGELRAQDGAGVVRWVAPDGLHITLKFLGEVPPARLAEVESAVAEVARGCTPFGLSIAGLGCFPRSSHPSILWVGVEGETEKVERLQQAIEGNLAPLGFSPEGRAFSPHITIGRVRREAPSRERAQLGTILEKAEVGKLGEFRAEAVSLMRSDLQPTGAKYTCLAKAAFAESASPSAQRGVSDRALPG